jgi:hypothetical protein
MLNIERVVVRTLSEEVEFKKSFDFDDKHVYRCVARKMSGRWGSVHWKDKYELTTSMHYQTRYVVEDQENVIQVELVIDGIL